MRAIDWPIMIKQLMQSGVTQAEIVKKTGIKQCQISKIKTERICSDHFNQSIELLDLYLIKINKNPPRVGDYQ